MFLVKTGVLSRHKRSDQSAACNPAYGPAAADADQKAERRRRYEGMPSGDFDFIP